MLAISASRSAGVMLSGFFDDVTPRLRVRSPRPSRNRLRSPYANAEAHARRNEQADAIGTPWREHRSRDSGVCDRASSEVAR
jgi:hypothetical protein